MKKLLIFLLCGALLFSLTACKKTTVVDNYEEEEYPEMYVADLAINQFILDFRNHSKLIPQDLRRGDVEGECFFIANQCEFRIVSTEYGLHISILGGDKDEDLERLIRVFEDVCESADSSCTKAQLDGAKDFMKQQTATAGNYRVSNGVKILAFTPLVRMETVRLDCKIELLAMNYLPVEEETE